MKRTTSAFVIIAVALILFSGQQMKSQGPGVPKLRRIDLSGEWETDKGEQIIISQTPQMVSGSFAKGGGDCPLPGPNRKRPLYLSAVIRGRGVYEGSKLDGEMGGCTSKAILIQDCHLEVAYTVRFTAEKVTRDSIRGTYTPDYITYDERGGHYVNCQIKKGGGSPQPFSLTRKCKPDKGDLCQTLGTALRDIKAARIPSASTALYQNLQLNLGDEIAKIRTNLCDDTAAQAKLDSIEDNLDSLHYVAGQPNLQNNVTLGYIESGLKELMRMSCGVSEPSAGGSACEEGSKAMSDADKDLLKAFHPTLVNMLRTAATNIVAYDETKKCLVKMFGGSCAPEAFTKSLAAARKAHYEGYPVGDSCDQACQALGDWYEKLPCPEGLKKETIIAKCKLACIAPEWGQ